MDLAGFPHGPCVGMEPITFSRPQNTYRKTANQPSISQAVTENNLVLSFLESSEEQNSPKLQRCENSESLSRGRVDKNPAVVSTPRRHGMKSTDPIYLAHAGVT